MSIFHRTAYLALSTLLLVVPAACGGDDDDDNGDDNGNPDASVRPDAAVRPDAGGEDPDAAPTPDAAPVEGEQFLLSLEITALGMTGVIRNIATINTENPMAADLSLQPIFSPVCNADMDGENVGSPIVANDVDISSGTFTINFDDVTIPAGAIGVAAICGLNVVADFEVQGTVLNGGEGFCGDVDGMASMPVMTPVTGTFGTVGVPKGTPRDELPEPVLDCP